MAQVTIEVPEDVYNALKALAGAKGISMEDFCRLAFVNGLSRTLAKRMKK